ncbi:hypothetical protein BC830DRAFT_1071855 [Chytriomyces sp. MP71]|nr:hypothetical protein BC830DRAFT_1071855 [Chytriomyces sp. MP71]
MTGIVTRFAPSPTGLLHLGGLRTALFNYLLAKSAKGQFLLRVEDTDQTRTVPGAADSLASTLRDFGLDWDQGPGRDPLNKGPFVQSQRSNLYSKHAHKLLETGSAYRCFCTPSQLAVSRTTSKHAGYDRRCRHLSPNAVQSHLERATPFSVRLKVPDGKTGFEDLLHGSVEFNNRTLDDAVLLKSDGLPTYHLANVVDDKLMGVTHVIRGEEWIPSTPKHVLIYRAFGWSIPIFMHVPLLIRPDGRKLSKRDGDVNVDSLREKGYLPEAILNFVGMLGFTPSKARDIRFLPDFVEEFSLEALSKSPAIVSYPHLDRLNRLHIAQKLTIPDARAEILRITRERLSHDTSSSATQHEPMQRLLLGDDTHLLSAVESVKGRVTFVHEFAEFVRPVYFEPDYACEAAVKFRAGLSGLDVEGNARKALVVLEMVQDWTGKEVKLVLKKLAEEDAAVGGYAGLMKVVRYVLTGQKVGDDLTHFMEIVGKPVTLSRLHQFVSTLK